MSEKTIQCLKKIEQYFSSLGMHKRAQHTSMAIAELARLQAQIDTQDALRKREAGRYEREVERVQRTVRELQAIVDEYHKEKCTEEHCIDCGWANGFECLCPGESAEMRWKPQIAAEAARESTQ